MRKPTDLPLYWRGGRAYLDGRRWDKGLRALCPDGQQKGTSDPVVAARLARKLVDSWEDERQAAERLGLTSNNDLAAAGDEYIAGLAEQGKSASHTRYMNTCLGRALDFFDRVQAQQAATPAERRRCTGPRNLQTISPPDVRAFVRWLRTLDGRRGRKMGDGTIREHLAALSGVYARAISDGNVPMGGNPVAALVDRPKAPKSTTKMLEPGECAALLESARTLTASGAGGRTPLPCVHAFVAYFLYTGAREDEVRRAEVADLHFDPSPAYPDGWILIRGTKTEASEDRVVPLHAHHREVLMGHLRQTGRVGGLLFTGLDGGPVGDWRKTLDLIAARVGFPAGAVRTRRFRTSYASHRLTCTGADANTVRLEMGHTDLAMMASRYAAAQRSSERMGSEFSYRLDRWAHRVRPDVLARLAA